MRNRLVVSVLSVFMALSASAQKYEGVVDKTVAIVGNEAILISDIESEILTSYVMNRLPVDENTRCEVLESILMNKMFLMQARVDSLTINQDMVVNMLNQRIDQMILASGGKKELEDRFGKPLYKLREEWQAAYEDLGLIQQMQSEIRNKVPKLTPRDVKEFVDNTPEEDLPIVPEQYQMSQIVVYPDKEEASLVVKERLLELRERIMNGERFSTLARLYSQDPGSASKGGELGMAPKTIFWPVFSDAAMSLKVGQVSQIVETPDGFHIIQMIEKDGDSFNARHILLRPQYTSEDRDEGFAKLDSIKTRIEMGEVAFEMAAKLFSEDSKSRTNGGQMADEMTGSAFFDKDRIKPADYNVIKTLEPGQISEPFQSLDNEGRGNVVYKILKLDKVIPAHTASYDSDYDLLINVATSKKQEEAIEEFLKNKIKETYVVIDPMFMGCDFKYEGWIKDKEE